MKKKLLALLVVEFASPVPIYEQLKRCLKQAMAQGVLLPGDELPSIRELATLLKINPNTVARALRDLQGEGVAEGRAGKGFWVSANRPDPGAHVALFHEEFLRLMEKGAHLGIPRDTLRSMVNAFFGEES